MIETAGKKEKRETLIRPELEYESVEICYREHKVIRGVSFSLSAGEILTIVGESGSGKSTLLRACTGLLASGGIVSGGSIRFQGWNLPDLPEKKMRQIRGAKIGMIFQDAEAALCPIRTIGAQIYESLSVHQKIRKKEAKEQTLELFEKLRLRDGARIWDSYPFELSGGMNQRVGIAAAMLLRPAVLLADEPTSALDEASANQVLDELQRLRDLFGTGIVIVSHDLEVAKALSDTVLVLKEGTVCEYGPADQVLNRPSASYTRELLSAVPTGKRGEYI